jgi:hypothetical protein
MSIDEPSEDPIEDADLDADHLDADDPDPLADAAEELPPEAAVPGTHSDDEEEEEDGGEGDDYGEPFETRSFGGEFVWALGDAFTCKILRVRAGEKVLVSTRGRKDMTVMLTGGRAVLEVIEGEDVDRVEMLPAAPVSIHPDREHRLVAMTEVEMFTVYSPLDPA